MEIGFGVRFTRMPEAARASLTLLLADYYRSLDRIDRLSTRSGPPPGFPTML